MAFEIGSCVPGEVTAVLAEGFLVALPEGRVGLVSLSTIASSSRDGQVLHVGERLTVRILSAGAEGRLELYALPSE